MKPSSVSFLLKNHEKYLFTILILATISVVGFTIEKAYPQSADSQLKGPAMNDQKSDEAKSISDAKFTPKMYVKITSNQKPSQIVTPTGPGGSSDYSTWTFNYTKEYHEIEVGPNELTSKLTCINPGPLTKWFSVTLTGEQPPFPRPLPVP